MRPFTLIPHVWTLLLALCPISVMGQGMRFETLSRDQGLSQVTINTIVQDEYGFLWIGTQEGLNRFDGYEFRKYFNKPTDPNSLCGNQVVDLLPDKNGALWIATVGDGLSRLDLKTENFTNYRRLPDQTNGPASNQLTQLLFDDRGRLAVASFKGLHFFDTQNQTWTVENSENSDLIADHISCMAPADDKLLLGLESAFCIRSADGNYNCYNLDDELDFEHGRVRNMLWDDGVIWIATESGGLVRFDERANAFKSFRHNPDQPYTIRPGQVRSIFKDSRNNLWVGATSGLSLFNEDRTHFQDHFYREEGLKYSLGGNEILSMFEDRTGILWFGTYSGGVSKYNYRLDSFGAYKFRPSKPDGMAKGPVISVCEDSQGDLWMGHLGEGLSRTDKKHKTFQHYRHDPDNRNSLASDVVYVIVEDEQGYLWISTTGGLNRLSKDRQTFDFYGRDPQDPNTLNCPVVTSIHEDEGGDLWMGTVTGGLNYFTRKDQYFRHLSHDPGDPGSISNNFVWAIVEDHNGVLWVGTSEGLNQLDKESKQFVRYYNDPADPNSISHSEVLSIYESSDNTLWLATSKGLNRMNAGTNRFTSYTRDDGLPSDTIYGVLEDRAGRLWLSSNNGISRFDPQTETVHAFTEKDGLQSNEFNSGAHTKLRTGELVFGGVNGMNIFFAHQIVDDPNPPEMALTNMRMFNKPVALRSIDPASPLEKPIWEADQVTLDYRDYVVSFEFAGLHFANPAGNRYAYMLEGLDRRWIETDADMRLASYTNLHAGSYRFKVKAANKDGVWSATAAELVVTMKPAPWLSPLAYAGYVLLTLGLLAGFVRMQQRKLDRERALNERLIQVDKLKDQFLANTSHELRTPLNGMIGLAESLRDGVAGGLPDKALANLDMIIGSGRRLGSLVDDILDFSKLKDGAPQMVMEPLNLHNVIEDVLALSTPLIGGKPVVLINSVPEDSPTIFADEKRLQQILLNLVGNAVKFTKEGQVTLLTDPLENERLRLHVRDTGIGIPSDQLQRIFESFQQGDASTERAYGGTGLGLSVARELVQLHGCELQVQSKVAAGSDFSFTLAVQDHMTPVNAGKTRHRLNELDENALEQTKPGARLLETEAEFNILIVDDEAVNRRVLLDHLTLSGFRLTQVEDGPSALEELRANPVYDLVLLDVMMPHMSGFEVCERIREHCSVQELPVIFMTAKSQLADLVEGFRAGGNDFLTKPIRKPELLARVRTHLELLELARKLEQRVNRRTAELNQKNEELNGRYQELETLEQIVKTINAEVDYDHLITAMLQQGVVLFPEAERAAFLSLDTETDRYCIAGVVGYDMERLRGVSFSKDEIVNQYAQKMLRFQSGVYITDEFDEVVSAARLVQTEEAHSMAAVTIPFDDQIVGVLILLSHDQERQFADAHLDKLSRFREHVVSAVGKALVLKDLVGTQKRFQDAAHEAGMAEIVANVLHNVGNILNSAQVSTHLLNEELDDSRVLELFGKTCELLEENQADPGGFITNDSRGQQIPKALQRIQSKLSEQSDTLRREGRNLDEYVRAMTAALKEQQDHAQIRRLAVNADVNRLIREVLHLESYLFKDQNVNLKVQLARVPVVKLEPPRFMHILVYLLKNALEALEDVEREAYQISVSSKTAENGAKIIVQDNGMGIPKDHVARIYAYGFTTKPDHRGFGLHYCANAVKEMNGSIEIHSGGADPGTRVTLWFPRAVDREDMPDQAD